MTIGNWPSIPDDAIAAVRAAFVEANRSATERLVNVPNIRETALDDGFVEALIPQSAPRLLPSGAIVELQIHNIGGLRRFDRWETADIAVLIFVYNQSQLIAQKIGLLQSKRLYPKTNDVDDEDPINFLYGLNKFLRQDGTSPLSRLSTTYEFDDQCAYGALKAGDEQIATIARFRAEFGDAIYYMFYNPTQVPISIGYPIVSVQKVKHPALGCRVYSTKDVDSVLAHKSSGTSPTLAELQSLKPKSNWRVEHWADMLMRCKVGQQFDRDRDELVGRLIERRSGPIGAAIAISISLPVS